MINKNKTTSILYGLTIFAMSFILFFISIKYILGTTLAVGNIIAMLVFSLITGLISSILFLLNLKIAFYFFVSGLTVGFAVMINAYRNGVAGWGDLIGFLAFLMLTLAGLIGGLTIQLTIYLIIKIKSRNTEFKE